MKSRRKRTTRKVIFVFCEGDTEKQYVELLRSYFRVPIQIVTKVIGTKISSKTVDSHLRQYGYPERDDVYLLYDGDRIDTLKRLDSLGNGIVLISIPCMEFWFLLHSICCRAEITSDSVCDKLCNLYPNYKKGEIKGELKRRLVENWAVACENARHLPTRTNPSSEVYILVEKLAELAQAKNEF